MKETFDLNWLNLREMADAHAREPYLEQRLRQWLEKHHPAPWVVLDLGAGSGNNLRHLAPRLGHLQHWLLVDHDDALLKAGQQRTQDWAQQRAMSVEVHNTRLRIKEAGFSAQVSTLALSLSALSDIPLPAIPTVVTASALLDLVDDQWLNSLVRYCRECESAALLTLTVDGCIHWQPSDPDDALIVAAFNQHQRRDKGMGPALGSLAAARAAGLFRAAGFEVILGSSPWLLDSNDVTGSALQRELLNGYAQVAREEGLEAQRIAEWTSRHQRYDGPLHVGHLDVLALP